MVGSVRRVLDEQRLKGQYDLFIECLQINVNHPLGGYWIELAQQIYLELKPYVSPQISRNMLAGIHKSEDVKYDCKVSGQGVL